MPLVTAMLLCLALVAAAILGAGCRGAALPSPAVGADPAYAPSIETWRRGSHLEIEGYCRNDVGEAVVLRYELQVAKTGPSGTADSLQAGPITVPGGQNVRLARLSLDVSDGDHWRIELELYKGEELVDKECVAYCEASEVSAGRVIDDSR